MLRSLPSLFAKQALVGETSLSRFVHHASSEEKKRVYNRVIRQASEEQRALLDAHQKRSTRSKTAA